MLLASCDLLQLEMQQVREYRVSAPELDSAWLRQSNLSLTGWHWQIDYIGSAWQNNAMLLRTQRRNGSQMRILLKKQESAVLQAFPRFAEFPHELITRGGLPLWRPAGALLMWQKHNSDENSSLRSYQLTADWQEGFLSQVLSRLLAGGFDIRYLNVTKLRHYMGVRIQSAGNPSPWDHDMAYLLDELSRLQMDWYDIRLRDRVRVQELPPGQWQALNTQKMALNCPDVCEPAPELAPGLHYYFELTARTLWQFEVLTNGELLLRDF